MSQTIFRFEQYDVKLAVVARRVLLLEARTYEERDRLVWQPAKEWLERLARAGPERFVCAAGRSFRFPRRSGGRCRNLYGVDNRHGFSLVYLGTAFSRRADQFDRRREIDRLESVDPGQAELLRRASPTVVIRDRCFCKIPLTGERLDRPALTPAVRRYLRTFAPDSGLAALEIDWLPDRIGAELDSEIWRLAKLTARKSPPDVRIRKLMEDELW